jgi:S1-C subfamily serine protease
MKTIIYCLLLFAATNSPAFTHEFFEFKKVKEGFEDSPQNKFQNAWDNTFMFAATKKNAHNFSLERYGTASVVFKKETLSGAYIGLVTAKHVIQDNKGLTTKLIRSIQYDTMIDSSESVNEINDYTIVSSNTSSNYDVGLLVIKVPLEEAKQLTPLTFTNCSLAQGDPLVIIGFPAVMQRKKFDQNEVIKDSSVIRKRISEGFLVNEYAKNEYGSLIGTTADAMHGNSGGPVLDENGNFVSVQAAVKYDGIKYFGYERKNYYSAHSWIVDCNETKAFAFSSWQDFLASQATLPTEI